MNFLKVIVLTSLISCLLFTAITIVLSCLGITIPDVLIQYFFIVFGVELGATATIKIAKYKIDSMAISDKIQRKKENGVPLDGEDFSPSSNTGYCEENYDGGNVYG